MPLRIFTTLPLWLTAEAWQNTRIPIATEPGTDLGAIIFASHGDIEQLLSSAADLHGPSLENTVLVGVKDATVDHKRALDEYGVLLVTIDEIDRHGMAALMPRVLAAAGQGVNGVHVHFDMDIIDGTCSRSRRHDTSGRPHVPRGSPRRRIHQRDRPDGIDFDRQRRGSGFRSSRPSGDLRRRTGCIAARAQGGQSLTLSAALARIVR